MLRKIHFRLAALCTGITCCILFAMSLAYLYISEQGLKKSSFISFQNDMNTVISNMEQQTVITHEWLTKLEDNGKYQINLIDNGVPFLYNERNDEAQKERFAAAWDYFHSHFAVTPVLSPYTTWHIEFPFSYHKEEYYACASVSERRDTVFQALILFPLTSLERQIRLQRFLFLLLDLIAALALALFSWYFTQKILRPLDENQKKQIQFIASASHELRTPLSVILSCASASRISSGEEQKRFLSSIQSEGTRMARLIDDLLLLTGSDSQNLSCEIRPAELDTLLLEVCEAFEPLASEKKLKLSVHLPEKILPPCLCDKNRIRQVLEILLHNAISYTPEDGTIILSLSREKHAFHLSVADNGIGIPDSDKPHIFERFYRADSSRNLKEHFGLGLSIAAGIVKAHRGQLLVSDTPGGGSTFTLILL